MQTFLVEGSSSTEQRLPFSRVPFRGRHEKNKYTADHSCAKALFFFCTEYGVYFLNVSLWTKSYSVPLISIYDCIQKNQVPMYTQIY